MFRHILVPLDGSPLAETVLPAAVYLARVLGAMVTLLHVIERDAPREVHGELHLQKPDEARRYLDGVAAREFPAGIHVERHVHEAEVASAARGIALHGEELAPDLIVMCTHGSGGVRGFVFGRVAHQVVKLGTKPVLLVPPTEAAGRAFSCRRLLVPLDSQPSHEAGLRVAAALAKICRGELRLLMVVPTFGTLSGSRAATARLLPGTTAMVLDMEEREAEEYLRRHAEALEREGLTVVAEVRRGDAAGDIVRAAADEGTDIIVMATHPKAGLQAFWSGSATSGVTGRAKTPLLLVPVSED